MRLKLFFSISNACGMILLLSYLYKVLNNNKIKASLSFLNDNRISLIIRQFLYKNLSYVEYRFPF